MKYKHTFQNVINAVIKTGVFYKEFFFRTNICCEDLLRDSGFPKDESCDDMFIIRFSDGEKYVGSLKMTEDEFNLSSGSASTDTIGLTELGKLFPKAEISVDIELIFGVCMGTDGTAGKAVVDIHVKDIDSVNHRKMIRKWYECESINDLPVSILLNP